MRPCLKPSAAAADSAVLLAALALAAGSATAVAGDANLDAVEADRLPYTAVVETVRDYAVVSPRGWLRPVLPATIGGTALLFEASQLGIVCNDESGDLSTTLWQHNLPGAFTRTPAPALRWRACGTWMRTAAETW